MSGAVRGKVKLYTPSSSDAIADIRKVLRNPPEEIAACESQANTKLITTPATIQPRVPHTRMRENSSAGSLIWRNATELTRARVGI
ncbi:hypothetical protein D3C80_1698690 [compost metagenome]